MKHFIIMLTIVSVMLNSCEENNDIFDIKQTDLNIVQEDLAIIQEDFDIFTAELSIQYEANAVLNNLSREKFVITLFLRDVNKDNVPIILEDDIYAYIKHDGIVYKGKPTIKTFSQNSKNIATALVLDYSGSMYDNYYENSVNNLDVVKQLENAALTFVSNFNENDLGIIIKFGGTIDIINDLTKDKSMIEKSIKNQSYDRGGTALYDAIDKAIIRLQSVSRKDYIPAIIAFTDGQDEHSNYDMNYVTDNANKNKIPIFTVGLESSSFNPDALKYISNSTGGFYYSAKEPEKLSKLYESINHNIRNSYQITITWESNNLPPEGELVDFYIRVKSGKYVISELNKKINLP